MNSRGVVGMGRGDIKGWVFRGQQKGPGLFQFGWGVPRGHQTEVTDTDKPVRKDMEEKATDKLRSGQAEKSVGSGVGVVSGAEGHDLTVEGEEALVGDGGPVGVMAEVAENMLRMAEGGFGVGVPSDSSQVANQSFEGGRLLEMLAHR